MPHGKGFTTEKPPDYGLLCQKLITRRSEVQVLPPQPESPDFLRNQDFFRTFAPNILLAVFSDPNADPTGSGYLSVDKGQHGSYLPIQLEPDTVIYFYPW